MAAPPAAAPPSNGFISMTQMMRDQRSSAISASASSSSKRGPTLSHLVHHKNKAAHLRGVVKKICGGVVCMHIEIPPKDADGKAEVIYKEVGPFADDKYGEKLMEAELQLHEEHNKINEQRDLFTNGFRRRLNDSHEGVMVLDAGQWDPAAGKKLAIIDLDDLELIGRYAWQPKRLGDDCWYVFTEDDTQGSHFLHELLLNRHAQSLVSFTNGNTLDCRKNNLKSVPFVSTPFPQKELIEVDRKEKNTGVVHVTFEQSGHRWRFRWKVGKEWRDKYFTVPQPRGQKEKEDTRQLCMAFREERIKEAEQQVAWDQAYKTAWRNNPLHSDGLAISSQFEFFTKNTMFKNEHDDRTFKPVDAPHWQEPCPYTLGPWLRGKITKHCEGKWCLRWGRLPHEFIHCPTQAVAMAKLLERNQQAPNYSVNASFTEYAEGASHLKSRSIVLKPDETHHRLVISDEPAVVDALAEHQWYARFVKVDDEVQAVACNADANSIWQYAEDLVVYTKLQQVNTMTGDKIIKTPEDYFEHVIVQHSPFRHRWDCRPIEIQIAFAKTRRSLRKPGVPITPEDLQAPGFTSVATLTKERMDFPAPSPFIQHMREKGGVDAYRDRYIAAIDAKNAAAGASSSSSSSAAIAAPTQAASSMSSSSSEMKDEGE